MSRHLVAQAGLSLLCMVQAIATVVIDFNRTHAKNPLWTGHARFHVVWQSSTVVFLSLVELMLIWLRGSYDDQRFYLAALLAALSPLGFLTAFLGRRLFGGTLSDPNGIPPVRVTCFGSVRSLDLNLVAVLAALVSLALLLWIFAAGRP